MSDKILMTGDNIKRSLVRIAHEVIERNAAASDLALVGIHTRGVPIAERLSALINKFSGLDIPVIALDISRYRDDVFQSDRQPLIPGFHKPVSINGKTIVLVDDVLYTGRSVRAAMDALIDLGRPREVQLAIMIDRGHREMPIRADYIGKNIPSSRNEIIKVQIVEIDGVDEVLITGSGNTTKSITPETDTILQKEWI
jgi:pyrimidine operon attenuation protein/uracil phosphoribosyltransferase